MSTNNQVTRKSKQSGFTLVEIAIVLVIIGLILGGVLQGQTMIENARYKSFAKEMDSYRAAFHSFQDMYGTIPGDILNTAALDAAATAGNGGGTIGGGWCDANTDESCLVWSHLRYANLIPGDPTLNGIAARPNHAFGPVDGIATGNWTNGVTEHKLLIRTVPGEVAQRYDIEFDDGDATSGNIGRMGGTGAAYGTNNVNMYISL